MVQAIGSINSSRLCSSIRKIYPCRDQQINVLSTLLNLPHIPKNIVLYGLEATGKSAITKAILTELSASRVTTDPQDAFNPPRGDDGLLYAIIKSSECITGRHLLETTVSAVAQAIDYSGDHGRCENLAQLVVALGKLLESRGKGADISKRESKSQKFVLVFDSIDRQRDAPPTLLPALGRLGEIIPNLTVICIVTAPRQRMLRAAALYIHFSPYTKQESLDILGMDVPPLKPLENDSVMTNLESEMAVDSVSQDEIAVNDRKDVWIRFGAAIWDTLSKHSGRDIITFRTVCNQLWPSFTSKVVDGTFKPKEFSRLLLSNRSLFQDERVLIPKIDSSTTSIATSTIASKTAQQQQQQQQQRIGTQLPYFSRLLLVAAYLASYNPARTDQIYFMRSADRKRRKKGGGTSLSRGRPGTARHRKISRKLLGPQAFVLQRMLAIFHAIRADASIPSDGRHRGKRALGVPSDAATADVPMAIATLASLRLVVKTSGTADPLDASTKWRVNVGWDVVRTLARSVDIEIEDYLMD